MHCSEGKGVVETAKLFYTARFEHSLRKKHDAVGQAADG